MNPVPVSLPFTDRIQAGDRLAERVRPLAVDDPVVLALPRGGVPVGAELAHALELDFDVLLVRRIDVPGVPGTAAGAVSEDGHVFYDDRALARLRLPRRALEHAVEDERAELARTSDLYRGERPLPSVAGRDCVVVDDGADTGVTARAALRMLRAQAPSRLVLAVPVASPEAVEVLRPEVDELVVLSVPDNFRAVGDWYREFGPLTDGHVSAILDERARVRGGQESVRGVRVRAGRVRLDGELTVPTPLRGAVVMALGEDSGDPRWKGVAAILRRAGYATLSLDLLTADERADGGAEAGPLGERLGEAVTWLRRSTDAAEGPLAILGSGSAAPVALVTAAERPEDVGAVVVHGGRIDRAEESLAAVRAPVLVLLESRDSFVREIGEWARGRLGGPSGLEVLTGTEDVLRGAWNWRRVASESVAWFERHLP
ncbi:phosphoribosyltransferase family protein [Nocardiopsis salina]|uniref:phosphoribosyltransferase family protein n=1 Tax=Nocardiopsis salina TaxID=245836 RepID=UPI0004754858|nr:phosphoribosyltransferase family protein [Nocardiopsis salina]